MRIIFVDTETGGLDPSCNPVLTVGLAVWSDGEIGETTEFKVYGDPLRCEYQALAVNRIDLKAHNEAAIKPADRAAAEILRWCRQRWIGADRIRLGGHNVAFDVGFLRALIGPAYGRAFHHRPICTMSLLPFLWQAGKLPADIGKLGEACAAVGIAVDETTAHTALADAINSAKLYTKMLELVR